MKTENQNGLSQILGPYEAKAEVGLSPRGLGDVGIRTGLSIILADAARSHLKEGNLQKANLCLQEAERCLASIISS